MYLLPVQVAHASTKCITFRLQKWLQGAKRIETASGTECETPSSQQTTTMLFTFALNQTKCSKN